MITRLSHAPVYVKDQDSALAFYTEKLGLEKRTDITMDGFRWVTVGPKDQPDLEIVLMPIVPGPMLGQDLADKVHELLDKGAMGAGVLATDDCQQDYETLKARGVEFLSPPQERPYGIEATFKDDSGNWYSLTQHHAR